MPAGSLSRSLTTSASRSLTPLTVVTFTVPPLRLGIQATDFIRLVTSPLRQSPYILRKNGS